MQDEEKCFTFLWKLKNIEYCTKKKGEYILSPSFGVDGIEGVYWKLLLYPRGWIDKDYIGCFLYRINKDTRMTERVGIKFELALMAKDGSVLKLFQKNFREFARNSWYGTQELAKLKDVFISRKSEYLTEDTLTVRCRIWKINEQMSEEIRWFALTHFEIERMSIQWNVTNFNQLEPHAKCTYLIKSTENDAPLMSVDLTLIEGINSDENINFQLSLEDHEIKFVSLSLFLITSSGAKIECNKEEIWFHKLRCNQFTFSYTTKKLYKEKNMYLPNDTLSLFWECIFSRGVLSTQPADDPQNCRSTEIKTSNVQNMKIEDRTVLNSYMDDIKCLYDDHFLSDVKLKTKTGVFPAHKFILSVSSSVFKVMFSNDFKEKNTDCVNIEDLNDDTVSRLLLFMYTTRVEALTYESASELYVAADKYAVLNLKRICSSFLKENLSTSNACEVLLLSDLHADSDLKSTVQEYILKNGKLITSSENWKKLVEINAKLTTETLCLLFK